MTTTTPVAPCSPWRLRMMQRRSLFMLLPALLHLLLLLLLLLGPSSTSAFGIPIMQSTSSASSSSSMPSWRHYQQQLLLHHHRMWAMPLPPPWTATTASSSCRAAAAVTNHPTNHYYLMTANRHRSQWRSRHRHTTTSFLPTLGTQPSSSSSWDGSHQSLSALRVSPQPQLQPSLSSLLTLSSRPNTRLYAGSPSLLSLPSDSDSSDDVNDDDENENDDPVVASSDYDDYDDVSEGTVLVAVEYAEMLWEEALAARRAANELGDLAEKEAQSAQYTAQTADTIVRTDRLTGRAISMETLAQVDAAARSSMDATDMVGKAVRAGQHADSLEKKAEEALKRSEDLLERHLRDYPDDSTLAEPSGGDEDKDDGKNDDEDQL